MCCNANVGMDLRTCKKDDGTIYNLGTDGINDFNGKIMKETYPNVKRRISTAARCKRESMKLVWTVEHPGNGVFGKNIQLKK